MVLSKSRHLNGHRDSMSDYENKAKRHFIGECIPHYGHRGMLAGQYLNLYLAAAPSKKPFFLSNEEQSRIGLRQLSGG